jgi:hypothetical protein
VVFSNFELILRKNGSARPKMMKKVVSLKILSILVLPEVNFDGKILVGKHLQVISVRLISNWIATKQNATITKYQVTRAIGPLRPHTHRAWGRTYSLWREKATGQLAIAGILLANNCP